MKNIIRVFRARTKPGRESEFRDFFLGEAVEIVRQHAGLLAVEVGLPTPQAPTEFLMITTWSSLDDLICFTGTNWREAVIAPQEAPLLEVVMVHHYQKASLEPGK